MIPLVQFDPSSYCMWLDARVSWKMDNDAYAALFRMIMEGGAAIDVRRALAGADAERRGFGVALATSIYHERRHLLDTLFTNFGGLKHRLFLDIYANLAGVLNPLTAGGELTVPIDLHLNQGYREYHGIPRLPSLAEQVVAQWQGRVAMLNDDAATHTFRGETIQIGGEAQFEALAYITEIIAAPFKFISPDEIFAKQKKQPLLKNSARYRWALEIGYEAGLVEYTPIGDEAYFVDVTRIFPLLVASLMSRHWKQCGEDTRPAFPSHRLMAFIHELRATRPLPNTSIEIWHLLSRISSRIFGRSLEAEIEQDIAGWNRYIHQMTESFGTDAPPVRWAALNRSRREAILQAFHSNPDLVIDPAQSLHLLDKLAPYPLLCVKHGSLEDVPEGFNRIIGYNHTFSGAPASKPLPWWWLIGPNSARGDATFGFRDADLHSAIASQFAPVAKLLLHGRQQRCMLGAEMMRAEGILGQVGIKIRVDPIYGGHRERSEIESYAQLAGEESMICDLCSEPVTTGTAELLSKWIFTNEQNLKFILGHFASLAGGNPLAEVLAMKDWTEWCLCHACCSRLGVVPSKIRHHGHSSSIEFFTEILADKKPEHMRLISFALRQVSKMRAARTSMPELSTNDFRDREVKTLVDRYRSIINQVRR